MSQAQGTSPINHKNWRHLVAKYTIPERQASSCVVRGEDLALITPMAAQIVASNELFLEGIHFELAYTPLQYLAYRLFALALAKIYAKNAMPTQLQCACALTNNLKLEDMELFWQGLYQAAEKYAVDLVDGGSLSVANGAMVVSMQVLGMLDSEEWIGIDSFQEGQVLCVTGDLAAPYLALLLLEREKRIHREHPELAPNFENQHELLKNFFQPPTAVDALNFLREQGIKPLGMTHLLDGLASALFRISDCNEVGVLIYEDQIPIAEYVRQFAHSLPIDPTLCALNGGEETALLLALTPETYLQIAKHKILYPIGIIQNFAKGCKLQTKAGNLYDLTAQGWN